MDKSMWTGVFSIFLLAFPFLAAANAVINEVLFDPSGTDTGLEWIEVYNSGDASQDLSGWSLYPDGIGYFSFPQGFLLKGHNFVTVHLRATGANSAVDLYNSSASSNMGNTSGSAAIFSGEPRGKDTIKSFMEWGKGGETWESAAQDAGLWTKAVPVNLSIISEGNSIMLADDGKTDGGAGAWKVSVEPSPGQANNKNVGNILPPPSSSASSTEPQPPLVVSPPPQPPSPNIFIPEMHSYAGSDQETAAGALVSFIGYATIGSKNEPLQNARYWWNFGDGESQEGRSITHAFSIPGVYTVGLHVSSDIYSVSDYLAVRVQPNQLSVKSVVEGENGFFRLYNDGDSEVDIGGWIVEDKDLKRFTFPMKTKLAENADAAFSNRITGILNNKTDHLYIYYPNGEIALKWKVESDKIVAAVPRGSVATTTIIPSQPQSKHSTLSSSSFGGDKKVSDNLASTVTVEHTAAISLAPRLFLIGAIIISFLGAVLFLIFRKSFFP